MCGKNLFIQNFLFGHVGSPPRVREELISTRLATLRRRITPACAGRTTVRHLRSVASGDHPRVCGKNFLVESLDDGRQGSPPRVREELRPCRDKAPHPGITPACAGRTYASSYRPTQFQDHPRVCGKNRFRRTNGLGQPGSPPRVREEHPIGSF